MNRTASVLAAVGAFVALFASVSAAGAATAATAMPPAHDVSGVWWIDDYDPRLLSMDGRAPPFTDKGLAQYQQNMSRLASGELKDPALDPCLPEGLPRAMTSAYPLQIVQHGQFITVIHEANHEFWTIALNAKQTDPDDVNPAFMGGSSVGRWDGDTLTVDSVGFKTRSFIDATGVPHSDELHVVLRLRKIDAGKRMEAVMTVTDPAIFTSPWTSRRTYERRPDVKLLEFGCGDPHRYLPGDRSKAVILNWSKK